MTRTRQIKTFLFLLPITVLALLILSLPEVLLAQSPPSSSGYKIVVFTPRIYSSSPKKDLDGLFLRDFERHWPGKKIEVRRFSENNMASRQKVIQELESLADDEQVKAVIIGESLTGSVKGCARLRAKRPDIIIIAMDPHESLEKMALAATLTLSVNHQARGYLYPAMAKRMGAGSLVYFSFLRHQRVPSLARQHRIMSQVTRDLDMILVSDFKGPDPGEKTFDPQEVEEYLNKAVDRYLDIYGSNTAFMSTNSAYNELLPSIVMRKGGMALEALQPSLASGLPDAFDLNFDDTADLFGDWRRMLTIMDEKYMADKPTAQFSSWAYPYPHTVMLGMIELASQSIENQTDIYDLTNIRNVLKKFSPEAKWQVGVQINYNTDLFLPQTVVLLQDTYWLGHGYQGFTWLQVPTRYFHIP